MLLTSSSAPPPPSANVAFPSALSPDYGPYGVGTTLGAGAAGTAAARLLLKPLHRFLLSTFIESARGCPSLSSELLPRSRGSCAVDAHPTANTNAVTIWDGRRQLNAG